MSKNEAHRVCASCGWYFRRYKCTKYSNIMNPECPRCMFGSYNLLLISNNPSERDHYTSQQFWKERTHLPEPIADWIIGIHRGSVALESL